jgi:hypothetical protein
MQIINRNGQFNFELYKLLGNYIPQENYSDYFESIQYVLEKIRDLFPLLTYTQLPKNMFCLGFIKGILLPRNIINGLGLRNDEYLEYGLPVFSIIPLDFQTNGIMVFDSCNTVQWNIIEDNYKHQIYTGNDLNLICTHKNKDRNKPNIK